jgi:hypothetical protein
MILVKKQRWYVDGKLDLGVDIYDKNSRFFKTNRHPNAPRRSRIDKGIISSKGTGNICIHYFNAFAVLVNEFAGNHKIVSIGCDEFAIEKRLMEMFPLDIVGFDPYGKGDLVTRRPFNPKEDCDGSIRMLLHPYYEEHEEMICKVCNGKDRCVSCDNYDYKSLVGCKQAIVMYGKNGASGSSQLIKEMSKDRPFGLKANGSFTYKRGIGGPLSGATYCVVFLGGDKDIGTYFDDGPTMINLFQVLHKQLGIALPHRLGQPSDQTFLWLGNTRRK